MKNYWRYCFLERAAVIAKLEKIYQVEVPEKP